MNFEEGIAVTLERLASEADSLAELLERLRGLIPTVLIGDGEWQGVLERARQLPATMAAFPFGFELPLHDRSPGADLGISVVGGTAPAEFFERRAKTDETDPSATAIARLLHATEPDDSPLGQVVGRKMMLEYDIASAAGGGHPEPGIFLRPAERPIVGDGRQIGDVHLVLDALVDAVGWKRDAGERQHIERVYLEQQPDTRVESFGAFPSRERAIRIAVTGFRTSRDLVGFLERAGWPGRHSAVAATLSRLEKRGGFIGMGAHLDVQSGGLGSTLGLSFLAKERVSKDPHYWLDKPNLWTGFIDSLCAEGLGVDEKLSAFAKWPAGPTTLFGKSGSFVLLRGIHHVKLVLTDGRFEQVKGYVFLILIGALYS